MAATFQLATRVDGGCRPSAATAGCSPGHTGPSTRTLLALLFLRVLTASLLPRTASYLAAGALVILTAPTLPSATRVGRQPRSTETMASRSQAHAPTITRGHDD